jgi:hypothetical protein
MSGSGTFRTWRDVRAESVMRFKADIGLAESRLIRPPAQLLRRRTGDRSRASGHRRVRAYWRWLRSPPKIIWRSLINRRFFTRLPINDVVTASIIRKFKISDALGIDRFLRLSDGGHYCEHVQFRGCGRPIQAKGRRKKPSILASHTRPNCSLIILATLASSEVQLGRECGGAKIGSFD